MHNGRILEIYLEVPLPVFNIFNKGCKNTHFARCLNFPHFFEYLIFPTECFHSVQRMQKWTVTNDEFSLYLDFQSMMPTLHSYLMNTEYSPPEKYLRVIIIVVNLVAGI